MDYLSPKRVLIKNSVVLQRSCDHPVFSFPKGAGAASVQNAVFALELERNSLRSLSLVVRLRYRSQLSLQKMKVLGTCAYFDWLRASLVQIPMWMVLSCLHQARLAVSVSWG